MTNNFTIGQVRQFWNKTALRYEGLNSQFKNTHLQRFERAIKYLELEPNQKILNIWSRTGSAIPYLREKCQKIQIFNLEVSDKFIEIAKSRFPQEKFQSTNLEKLPFRDNCFDHILSLETLEHAPEPSAFLRELHRVLKPKSKLVMSLPPQTAELPLRIYETFFRNHGEGPHRFLASKMVKGLLREAGFKLKEHRGTLLIPVGPKAVKNLGEKIIERCQNTFVSELGIRQFYVAEK